MSSVVGSAHVTATFRRRARITSLYMIFFLLHHCTVHDDVVCLCEHVPVLVFVAAFFYFKGYEFGAQVVGHSSVLRG